MNIFFSILLLIGLTGQPESELLTAEKVYSIQKCQKKIFECDESIYEYLDSWRKSHPDDPGPYLFHVAAMQTEMTDREEELYNESFKSLCDTVKTITYKFLETCTKRDSSVCYLYLGHMYAYRSLYEARFGSRWSSVRNGYKAYDAYKKGLIVDSTFYDLYLGIGSFHYWKSAKSGILRTIGFIKNEKEKGIREVKMAIDFSLVSQDAAWLSLIHIYINEEKYDSAILVGQKIDPEIKVTRTVRWPLAFCYLENGDYKEALDYYWGLYIGFSIYHGNYYNIIEAADGIRKVSEHIDTGNRLDRIREFFLENYKSIPKKISKRQKNKLKLLLPEE